MVVTLETEAYFNDQSVRGMCGSFDDNRENDFKNNEDEYVAHAAAFANSWKITDYETVVSQFHLSFSTGSNHVY